ncbi:MAG: DUF1311 domain-containing protein [Burkholderiales bacterium]|nr:DUF1311 domain-containing protein [Burkholderiales bacterium]
MKSLSRIVLACTLALSATLAVAGAFEECNLRGDQATVSRCLVEAEDAAQAALVKAEGDAGKLARQVDTATGRPVAAAALARSMRAFSDYRKAHCDFVRAMLASAPVAEQGQLGCMVDMTRRRVRDLQN